jgi:hypothetical protein
MPDISPEHIVQANLDAYNARGIDAFMTSFSDDVEMVSFTDGSILAAGLESVRSMYLALFEASPKLHSAIKQRMILGNKVIDHEHIVGRNGSDDVLELILIYEVENALIKRITTIRT